MVAVPLVRISGGWGRHGKNENLPTRRTEVLFRSKYLPVWKILKKIDLLKIKNVFYNSFGSESLVSESENQISLQPIVWLVEVGEGMEISHFTF